MKRAFWMVPLALGIGYLGFQGKIYRPTAGRVATAGEQSKTKTVTTTFRVEGMTCGSCEWAVQKALKELDGVISAKASNETASATIEYIQGKITPAQMIETVTKLGYKASWPKR